MKLELSPIREANGKTKEADEEETFSDNFWQSMYRLPNLTEEPELCMNLLKLSQFAVLYRNKK